ncbi:MAG: HDOD domain-containing protein [Fibrobacterota bacterium]
MNRILFVDSEESIVNALLRCFQGQPYEMASALSLSEAEDIFSQLKPQMLIIDISMEQMKGRAFVKKMKELTPSLIVIVLTAYNDSDTAIDMVGERLAKLYMIKPWDNAELRKTVSYLFTLYNEIKHRPAIDLLSDNFDLMQLPSSYINIHSMILEEKDMISISEEVEKDPVLSSKLLSLVNNAFYGLRVSSVKKAVSYLGLNVLENMLLSIKIFDTYTAQDGMEEVLSEIWEHSNRTNRIFTGLYSAILGKNVPEEYSSVVLLHDMGKMMMMNIDFNKFLYCYNKEKEGEDPSSYEKQVFSITHSMLGAFVMDWWNLPGEIIEAALYHHDPDNPHVSSRETMHLISLANVLDRAKNKEAVKEEVHRAHAVQALFDLNEERLYDICYEIVTG